MAEKRSPDEFRSFVRDLGIRAFDQLASRFGVASEVVARRVNSISRLATDWSNMQPSEKEQFFDQMIDAARTISGFPEEPEKQRKGKSRKAAGETGQSKTKRK